MSDMLQRALDGLTVEGVEFNVVKDGVEIVVETEDKGEIVFYQNPVDPVYDQLVE